ncbi:MAG: hypothetical protein AAFR73_06410 [Pseudomonadota bacterium]
MTEGNLEAFLSDLQDAFLECRWDELASFFQRPLVIYSQVGVSVFRSEAQIRGVLQQYREALGGIEVASTTLDVDHRDTTFNHRLRTTVRITDMGDDGQPMRRSVIRYFLVEEGDSYKIEMLEYIESSLPIAVVQRVIH